MTDTPTPPDGWYPDPAGSGGTRRWDGSAWTDEVRPAIDEHADAAPLASPPESSERASTVDVAPEAPASGASPVPAHAAPGETPAPPVTPPAPVAYAAGAPAPAAHPHTPASSDPSGHPAAPVYPTGPGGNSAAPGHPSGPAYPAAAGHPSGPAYPAAPGAAAASPATKRDIPTDTVWVWLIVALPLVWVLALFLFDWRSVIEEGIYAAVLSEQGGYSSSTLDFSLSSTLFSLGLTALQFVVGGVSVLFAFLDWRQLGARGIDKPFHWAWAFFVFVISAGVYVIGRGVVLRRQTGKGLGPVWGFIAVTVVSIIISTIWLFLLLRDIFALMEQLTYMYGY